MNKNPISACSVDRCTAGTISESPFGLFGCYQEFRNVGKSKKHFPTCLHTQTVARRTLSTASVRHFESENFCRMSKTYVQLFTPFDASKASASRIWTTFAARRQHRAPMTKSDRKKKPTMVEKNNHGWKIRQGKQHTRPRTTHSEHISLFPPAHQIKSASSSHGLQRLEKEQTISNQGAKSDT